jgi:hypothetical protein
MAKISSLNNGLTSGFGQGVGLYNALASAPIQRRQQLAQAELAEKKLNAPPPDMVDAGIVDPRLAGHKTSIHEVLPFLLAKPQAGGAGPGGAVGGITPGRKAADMAFGKDYVEWTGGGASDVDKSLAEMKSALADIQSDESLTGPTVGKIPDFVRTFTNPKAVDVQQRVANTVQRSLRPILGSQFTENEAKRIIQNAYNPQLSTKENAVRVGRIADQISQMKQAKQEMADYFEQYGTLTGYKGRMPSSNSISFDEGQQQNAGQPAPQGAKRYKILSVQ